MNKMTDKIIEVVSEILGVSVNENTTQNDCEKWDSLRHLNIMVALEDAFDVSFEPEEMAEMKSIVAIEQMIQQKK